MGFPLGKTGGLIEAVPVPAPYRAPGACFRWVKPAASLKQYWRQPYRLAVRRRFRWVKPAASLKRELLKLRCVVDGLLVSAG